MPLSCEFECSAFFAILRNLKSKQDPLRSLYLHYSRSDVVARTHLRTKLGAPVCYIPFETVRRDYRRPSDWYYTNILSEIPRSYWSMNCVLPFLQKKHHAFRCDKIQVTNRRGSILGT